MGTEFFDELSETITRTAKGLGERAELIYETQKLRNKIAGEDRMIDKIMADLGNILYKQYSDGAEVDEGLKMLCEQIDQHKEMIREYKEAMARLKGKKLCPSCHEAVALDAAFCPHCGAACPVPETEQKTEEEEEKAEATEVAEPEEAEEDAVTGSGDAPETAESEGALDAEKEEAVEETSL